MHTVMVAGTLKGRRALECWAAAAAVRTVCNTGRTVILAALHW
jgi:hypothetical protein